MIVETAASGASSARDISVKFHPRHLALRCQLACKPSPVRKQTLGAGSSSGITVTNEGCMLAQCVRGADH